MAREGTVFTVLVTGSRDWGDMKRVRGGLEWALGQKPSGEGEYRLLHGGARGVDLVAAEIASELGFAVREYPADWDRLGRRAGVVRNQEMVDSQPDLCIAFIRNNSRGATHCANAAMKAGIRTVVARED